MKNPFKSKSKESQREVVDAQFKYVVFRDNDRLANSMLSSTYLFKTLEEAKASAEESSRYWTTYVAEIKPILKFKSNPVVEVIV